MVHHDRHAGSESLPPGGKRARTRAGIVEAAFELFGSENGLYTRIEDLCAKAGISRQTFYNHFSGMDELREALSYELSHDFLVAVTEAISGIPDAAERASAASRLYLERGRADPKWAWSIVNISANGIPFGRETHMRARQTIEEGMADGRFILPDASLGRDLLLGTVLACLATQLRHPTDADYPARVLCQVLIGLGMSPTVAAEIARRPLPSL